MRHEMGHIFLFYGFGLLWFFGCGGLVGSFDALLELFEGEFETPFGEVSVQVFCETAVLGRGLNIVAIQVNSQGSGKVSTAGDAKGVSALLDCCHLFWGEAGGSRDGVEWSEVDGDLWHVWNASAVRPICLQVVDDVFLGDLLDGSKVEITLLPGFAGFLFDGVLDAGDEVSVDGEAEHLVSGADLVVC